jgi:ribosomal protein S14
MARTALKAKQWKMYEEKFIQKKDVKWVKYYNRCRLCGRSKW